MLRALILSALLAFPAAAQEEMDLGSPPAGTYTTDPAHTRLWFIVDHLGFSRYMALFTRVEATLQFDPEHPEAMSVRAVVDVGSLETHNPATEYDFNAIVSGEDLLNAPAHPQATFVSTKVEATDDATALSIVKVDVLEANIACTHAQCRCIFGIHHGQRLGDRLHAILHRSDRFEDAVHHPHDPT